MKAITSFNQQLLAFKTPNTFLIHPSGSPGKEAPNNLSNKSHCSAVLQVPCKVINAKGSILLDL
jgi:hypothetical protein